MAEVTLEGRAGTRLEPSRAGLGQAWGWTGGDWSRGGEDWGQAGAGLGLGWRGTRALLSRFACLLAAVGGRSGCTPSSKSPELCNCFEGCVGMLRHGMHLQLPGLGFSAEHLASVTVQERYEIRPQGISIEVTAPHKPAEAIYTAWFLRVSCAPPTLHLIPGCCGSLCSPPTPGTGGWLGPDHLHSRNGSRRQGENWQPVAEK